MTNISCFTYVWLRNVKKDKKRRMLLTCFLTYQGYKGILVVNFSCAREYLVAVTGTTESISPLSLSKIKNKKRFI